MQNEALFRDKPVWSAIFSMAIPSVFTILVMIVYNMADMFFIGRLGDTAQVGAISIVGPVFSLLSAVSTMIGVGGCATIAKALGGGQTENARTCASLCGWTFLLFGVVFAAAALVFTDPLLRMLGATPDMWHYAGSYMRILALGAPVMLFSQGMAMLIRSEGAIKEGLIGNLSGTVVNLILDPVFILGLNWGVAGAAAATVLGNLVGSAYFAYYILRKSGILNLKPQCALRSPGSLLPMMALGLPNALSSILSGLASTFSNRLLSAYGTSAIAAMGAAGKITMLVGLVQMGICMGVQPMMAYNYGAGNLARLKEILLKTALLAAAVGVVTTVGCSLARHTLIGLFLRQQEAAAMGEKIAVFLLLAGPVLGLYYLSANFLQAAGNAPLATAASVLRQGAVLIPLLYLMAFLFGFTGIAIAHTASDVISALIGLFACLWQFRRLKTQLLTPDQHGSIPIK